MKKYFHIITLLALLIISILPVPAMAVKSGSDEIVLNKPAEGETVSGTYTITWLMRDADQTSIPFQIDLFANTCSNRGSYVGSIGDNAPPLTGQNDNYSMSWNTGGPIENVTTIANGDYCLRICAVFIQNGNNYYSLCDKHSVVVNNTGSGNGGNKAPEITSNPPTDLDFVVGENFSYDVNATDPDGDTLTYELKSASDILDINAENGQITSKDQLDKEGVFTVKVSVRDDNGGTDEQTFNINVTESESPYTIAFVKPAKDEVLSGDTYKVQWTIDPKDDIKRLILDYSQDGSNWTTIIALDSDAVEYDWALSEIEPGKYFLRLQVETNSTEIFSKVSEIFNIEGDGELAPVIKNIKPANDSVITELKPEIAADFSPTEEGEVVAEDVIISLDDRTDALECQIRSDSVSCVPNSDLSQGRHKVNLQVTDSNERVKQMEWFFEVDAANSDNDSDNINIGGLSIPRRSLNLAGIILCVGALLLIIPWLLYYFVSRRNSSSSSTTTTVEEVPPAFNQEFSTEPIPAGPPSVFDTTTATTDYAPSIGSQTLGENSSDFDLATPTIAAAPPLAPVQEAPTIATPIEPVPIPAPTVTASEEPIAPPEVSMPSSYSQDEVPDWLKDFEADQPITQAGSTEDLKNEANTEAQIHDDYGLALNADEQSATENNPDESNR